MISQQQKELALQYVNENIQSGLNCSESIWNALLRAGIADFPPELTALASGLNGGVGSAGFTCGALSGAMLCLSAVYGHREGVTGRERMTNAPNVSPKPAKPEDDPRYYYMRRFNGCVKEFEELMGTSRCQDIVDASGGYYSPKRQEKCVQMIHCGLRLALKYTDMPKEEADRLPYGRNLFDWK